MFVKPKRIRLLIKPYCGWCHKAERWLDEHEVEYDKVDVVADESGNARLVINSSLVRATLLRRTSRVVRREVVKGSAVGAERERF